MECNVQTAHTPSPLRWHGRDWVDKDGNLICALKHGDAPEPQDLLDLIQLSANRMIQLAVRDLSIKPTHAHTHTSIVQVNRLRQQGLSELE